MSDLPTSLDRTIPLAIPALLAQGGDDRSIYAPATGLNRYGCATRPRPGVLALGSCTSSSPTPEMLAGLEPDWQAMAREPAGAETWLRGTDAAIRQALAGLLGAPEATAVLVPSGTDAELLIAWMALDAGPEPVLSLCVGAAEAGSGTLRAAGGRRFSAREPLHAEPVEPGTPIAGFPHDRLRVEAVALRGPDGESRGPDAIEAEVERALAGAIARGERCLLHVMAHSKTGLHAPRLAAVERWRAAWPGRLQVVVDAAQGRIGPAAAGRWLAAGSWVLFTGSKFYGAPAFAGAVLFPAGTVPRGRMPAGFSAYFSRSGLPSTWQAAAEPLAARPNAGLTFRWLAALAAMRAHLAIAADLRQAVYLGFQDRLLQAFGNPGWLTWHPPDLVCPDGLPQTVFSFSLAGYDLEALRRLHGTLNTHPDRPCHLGQAVALGGDVAVLRIALGAPLATQLARDPALGSSLDERLAWLARRFEALRDDLAGAVVVGRAS